MLGFSAEELLGRNMHDMVHHHFPDGRIYPREECIVYKVFWRNQPFSNLVDHIFRKDGSMFWADMSGQPIVVGQQVRGAVVTFRDITQARQAEEALRRSEKLAAVGQLASSIAHEINNPLEAVINLLYLVRTAESMEDVKTYAMLAESELARMSDITLQTLRFHRQQTDPAPVDLNETIPAVLRLYTARFHARKVLVMTRLWPTSRPMLLEGDLRQVLNNLIRNAYDAMPTGGKLHVRLRKSTCEKTGTPGVRITIADTGTGFLPRIRKHLFEPFHTSKDATGTGLGLWISKGIVDKHQGRMQLRSRLLEDKRSDSSQQSAQPQPHGTVFALWFPLQPAFAQARP